MKRRSLLSLIAAIPMAITVASAAQAETWRLAHQMPPDSPEGRVWQLFADKAEEYTKGEVKIRVFPANQLGKTQAVIEQVKAGTVQIYAEGPGFLDSEVPAIRWIGAPFLFDNREHWVRFMHSDLVKGWFKQVEDKVGISVIGDPSEIVRGPFRVIVSKKKIANIDDLQGVKLRMYSIKLAVDTWNHLGAEVVVMGWSDVYEGLRRGLIGAVTAPLSQVQPMRFTEPAKFVGRTDEFPQCLALMTNTKAWKGLSEEARQGLLKAHADAAALSQKINKESADKTIADMRSHGVTYTEIDTSGFVKRMKSMYDDLEAKGELPAGLLKTVEETRG